MSPRVLLLAAAVALCAPSAEARAFATKAELSDDIFKCLTAVPSGVGCCAMAAENCPTANDGGTTEMPDWDVSAITDFSLLFQSKSKFDADISGWDVSSVTNMQQIVQRRAVVQPADRGLGRVLGDEHAKNVRGRVGVQPADRGLGRVLGDGHA